MTRTVLSGLRLTTLVLLSGVPAFAQTASPDTDRDAILHVLNRTTFGPRPGDVEMVEKMGGIQTYIHQQLHPETIDDSAVEQQVAQLNMLQMSSAQLLGIYKDERQQAKARQQEQVKAAVAAANPPAQADMQQTTAGGTTLQPATPRERMGKLLALVRSPLAVDQLQQAKLLRAADSNRQLQEVLVDFWSNHFNIDVKKNLDRVLKVADDREVIRPHILGSFRELLEASAKSPAMLVYLDNWQSTVPRTVKMGEVMVTERIHDQMMANGNGAFAPEVPKVGDKKGGINENYGREIMELHTLGVDGGYTQKDVQEVARCFTGWSINRDTGEFQFHPRMHDNGEKVVLGHVIPANGGMQDGETVLDILAASPATAHHIALEMCERFVSDDPPHALVDRIAGVFTQTCGDLRAVTEAVLTSPEFLSPSDYNTKIKSPLEFAVSAVRATDSTLTTPQAGLMEKAISTMEGSGTLGRQQAVDRINKRPRQSLNWHIYDLGEPLFGCAPPTGYSEVSRTWVSPGALIERLNFALALTEQKVSDVKFDAQSLFAGIDLDQSDAVLDHAVDTLLQGRVSDATRKVLQQTVVPQEGADKTVNPNKLVALIIGSPEFQRK